MTQTQTTSKVSLRKDEAPTEEVAAPVATDTVDSSEVMDEIDSIITETEQQFDDVLISAVRGEKVQRIRQGRTTTGSRAWTMGGSVD